ncbi:hypothetical protein [Gemmatimonas groenlandica]|uniref:Uncharacterized protein n=1 Tax=Gemmatimonas groenlandica TaxID=2732249 RepID=A0A6M4IS87_9BACT|nr:hypothetical protein [Gemmatimonas groenlandica]QJR37490.1 hypothetical protein HKW67_19215 [Gemmatimonas groenlandica]
MPQQTTNIPGMPASVSYTANEVLLRSLQQRREVLADQYETAMRSRGQIGQERLNAQARGDASMVREYDVTIERLGTRMREIERSIEGVDRQIDVAMKQTGLSESPLTVTSTEPAASTPLSISVLTTASEQLLVTQRLQFQKMMMAEAAVLLALGALLWRFGFLRGRRQAPRVDAPRDESRLQESIDAIAIEVERLSEGQRFVNNVMSARRVDRDVAPAQPPLPAPNETSWITPH